MALSYQEVLVDVVRYKYLCDEGFVTLPPTPVRLPCQEDAYFRHLVQCLVSDTGMDPTVAERGLIHAAFQHGRPNSAFFQAVVAQLYA
jgi:hypothetical protein